MTSPPHPSYFALDGVRLAAPTDSDPATGSVRAHLRVCAACAAYVGGTSAGPAAPASMEPLPTWLAGARLTAPVRAVAQQRASRASWDWRRWWPALPVVALATLLLVPWPHVGRHEAGPGDVREKGTPSLRVFIKRGPKVFTWDGLERVRAGDHLRFEVHGAGTGFISVAARTVEDKVPTVLYAGRLIPATPLLPLSFQVDADPRADVVSVITATQPIDAQAHALADEAFSGAERSRQILVFRKGTGE
jgi:hypothetical protein